MLIDVFQMEVNIWDVWSLKNSLKRGRCFWNKEYVSCKSFQDLFKSCFKSLWALEDFRSFLTLERTFWWSKELFGAYKSFLVLERAFWRLKNFLMLKRAFNCLKKLFHAWKSFLVGKRAFQRFEELLNDLKSFRTIWSAFLKSSKCCKSIRTWTCSKCFEKCSRKFSSSFLMLILPEWR